MEDKDIERCNQLIKIEHANWIGISNQLAIKHLLEKLEKKDTLINTMQAEFERLEDLEDNTDILKSELDRLQKENEELKEERELVGLTVKNIRSGKTGIVLHKWKSGSIAVLERIEPLVINTHDNWNTLEIITSNVKQIKTKCDNIPKSVIQDKLNELKECDTSCLVEQIYNNGKKALCKELLNKGDK